ncbi:MAG: hypothetical protein U1E49_09250 [Hyphomicrobiaceae bacterium]
MADETKAPAPETSPDPEASPAPVEAVAAPTAPPSVAPEAAAAPAATPPTQPAAVTAPPASEPALDAAAIAAALRPAAQGSVSPEAAAPRAAPVTSAKPTVYKAGGGRKFVLTVVLLVLMPFLISLPVMVTWRATAGHLHDALTLGIGGAIFVAAALFLLVHIVYSYRSRIEVRDDAVKLTVPRWRGPTPGLRYVKYEIPYSELDKVETRGEIYKEIAVPTLLRSAVLTTKTGERIHLGYVHEASEDPAFPIAHIAEEISRRSGVPLGVKASVKVGSQYKALVKGTPAWEMGGDSGSPEHEMARAEYERLVQKNHVYMFYLAFILFGLAAIAFIVDVGRSGLLNTL